MMKNSLRHKQLISVFMALMMILSLVACGGSSGGNEAGPEGAFYNTQLDEDDGKGFQPTDEYLNDGYLTFNSDGTGKWEYALDNNIEWKLKGDKLTIVEKWVDPEHGEQEETYKATWDGEKLILNHYGYLYIFEKTDGPTSPTGTESPDSNDKIVGLYEGTGSDLQGTKLDPSGEWLELMEDGRGKWFLGATEDTFSWTINGNEMYFKVDVVNSDIKMPYTAIIDQEEITLDTGMLYYFTKKASVSTAEITSIEGGWKCIEMTMEEQGITKQTEEIEEMNSMKADEIIQFTAYGDGTADMIFYGDEAEIVWSEENGKYVLKLSYDGVVDDSSIMDGVIEDNKLIIKMMETYTSDDKEIETIMSYIFEHQGKVSKFFKTLDFELTDEEILKMSNSMLTGQFIEVDGNLYGNYGGESVGAGTFSMGKLEKGDEPSVNEIKKIEDRSLATYLNEHNGYIYGILNSQKIFRIESGQIKLEILYEGTCSYLQIFNEKIYFSDENYQLNSMELDGTNQTVQIGEMAMYYTYILPNQMVMYQHDSDNESIHFYDLKTGDDIKVNDVVSYCPIIYGDYLYFTSPEEKEDEYTFNRLNLYSGSLETAPGITLTGEFMIENGNIVFAQGGLPTLRVEEWDKLSEGNYGGMSAIIYYSNGETRLYSDSNGKMYLTFNEFNKSENVGTIGYKFRYR